MKFCVNLRIISRRWFLSQGKWDAKNQSVRKKELFVTKWKVPCGPRLCNIAIDQTGISSIFSSFSLFVSEFFLNFAKDSDSPQGLEGHISYWKRTLRTLSSTFEFSQNSVSEDAQPERPLRVYCMQYLHLCRCHRWRLLLQYHTAWAISSCLSLYEAMREPCCGIGET